MEYTHIKNKKKTITPKIDEDSDEEVKIKGEGTIKFEAIEAGMEAKHNKKE
jgi:hypothetical protein